ncbi:PREDICTED: cytochrome P450 302a1, mitochondrial-like isoform X2 [Polistes dominula]|uniref:Cytochrome P450 302a1, mitochondrial-like isoform X2 n=1 Tax=Polistes dominula TaxID=743375 RepID=A0ABM1IIL1_POLDO|nr:PREDICTED: cytochrome P450 302a1, mitochondrial-like isoform X2 [Polistes dominula]
MCANMFRQMNKFQSILSLTEKSCLNSFVNNYSIKCSEISGETTLHSFQDIPGPISLPLIGTLYKYIPLIGEYSFTRLYDSGVKKKKQYGSLVREEIVPGVQIVYVYRPEDIAEIFKAETSLHPERRSHLALLKYRKDRSDIYNTGGLLPTNGQEWWRLRKEFQKVLNKINYIINYLEDTDRVIKEFIPLCTEERYDDFLPLLSRLFLELTCLTAFDVRMNSFSKEERQQDSRTSKLIDAAFTTNSAILKLDNGPALWRYFDTFLYKKLCKAQNYMEEIAIEMVNKKIEKGTDLSTNSLLDAYLKNPALDKKDIVGMACDMLLAGIDTTSYTMSFVLYHLGKNPECQEKLRSECLKLLPDSNQDITVNVLRNAEYAKAVIKETFRLNPVSVGIGRVLQTDIVLNGYCVPKGTIVVTQNQVTCQCPEYFNDPHSFIPERWLQTTVDVNDRHTNSSRSINPYLVLPFGHGPRSCIARRFAEQSMRTLLIRMCRELEFTWSGDNLGCKSLLINKPDGPIKLNFTKYKH